MSRVQWERIAPLAGILAVVLWIVGAIILDSNSPSGDPPSAQAILDYYNDEGSIYAGVWVFGLGTAFFLWFLGSLRARLFASEGGPGRLSTVAFAGGVGTAILSLALLSSELDGIWAADEEVSGEALVAIFYSGDGFFGVISFTGLAFAAATAIVALRNRALPTWLGWLTVLLAIGFLAFPIIWITIIFVFPTWLVITSFVLWRWPTAVVPVQPAG